MLYTLKLITEDYMLLLQDLALYRNLTLSEAIAQMGSARGVVEGLKYAVLTPETDIVELSAKRIYVLTSLGYWKIETVK